MTALSLAALHAALLREIEVGADLDSVVTLEQIRQQYPDEYRRICRTIATTVANYRAKELTP